ncbi:MAG TPA: hypothetical protein DCM67_01060 [Propionibacteriaceae bacterium]|nr:hypothetical protein [Propionibacteriaceae bacterium]
MDDFEDSRLEDPVALSEADDILRPLAESGARLRREALMAQDSLAQLGREDQIRAMITFGPEARLLRAVLEPTCPVPLVAWPRLGLPGWVGPLDVVVVLGGGDKASLAGAFEVVRRGCRLLIVAPPDSLLAQEAGSSATTLLPTTTGDPLAAAIVALAAVNRLGLGPEISIPDVADAMDAVATESSAQLDISQNPAKAVALELADAAPLVWGGSILAARASRRIAEALRAASGRVVLSADTGALEPLLSDVPPRDPFADPFEDDAPLRRPGLVMIDDGRDDEQAMEERRRLSALAQTQDVMISDLAHDQGDPVERYVTVLLKGLFAASYLRIGLARRR